MNKKIASEVAIGIIFLVSITFTVLFWFTGNTNRETNYKSMVSENVTQEKEEENQGQKAILVKRSGDMNYVIYIDAYGNESIIDKAPWDSENFLKEKRALSDYSIFSSANFSPKENYILYKKYIYEDGDVTFLYDIANKKLVEGISGDTVEFTPNEEYVYSCKYGNKFRIDLFSTGKVYKTDGFEDVYDVFGKTEEGNSQTDSGQKTERYNGYRIKSCGYGDYSENLSIEYNGIMFYLEESSNPENIKTEFFKLD